MMARVVLALQPQAVADKVRSALIRNEVLVDVLRGRKDLWHRMSRENADIFIVSRSLISKPMADAVSLLRELPESPMVVVLSERIEPEEESALLASGCEAVLVDDLGDEQLSQVLATLLSKRAEFAHQQLLARRGVSKPSLSNFAVSSPSMKAFMGLVRRVAASDTSLLIQGETGVGKEYLGRAIHAEGPRAEGPFIAVNCGALPESLLESELFGHEEGAFTGASRARRGWFEVAHRGTIFLDEIGEMPYHLQVKLLRVLQEREIQRVGSERLVPIDVRVMAATNHDLEAQVEAKQFRQDLYYRLSVVALTVPPLRERREDIPELVDSYVGYFQTRIGSSVEGISDEALDALCRYSWPGNVRELINVIERAMLLSSESIIALGDLPENIACRSAVDMESVVTTPDLAQFGVPESWLDLPWRDVRRFLLDAFEKSYLTGLLRATRGRVGLTAQRAGMRPRSLYEKMKRYGLCKENFRQGAGEER